MSKLDEASYAGPETCPRCAASIPRRRFLLAAGGAAVAAAAGRMPVPFRPVTEAAARHLVPEEKGLDASWLRELRRRGVKEVFSGTDLDNIGMPCGGIGAGQLYVCGDGTLGDWQIFNDAESRWVDGTFATYAHRGIAKPVDQGFAVAVKMGGVTLQKPLRKDGFADIHFRGEYPIATIQYREDGAPVKVDMEVFSPFIPLNARDSALPATMFHITVENAAAEPIEASVLGWLQNAVGRAHAMQYELLRSTRYTERDGYRICLHSAAGVPLQARPEQRPPIVFETFEGEDFGGWTATGGAFGTGPTRRPGPKNRTLNGMEGEACAASLAGGDGPLGTLTSPRFRIERDFINFLVAGGSHWERNAVTLVVDGKVVRRASGKNDNNLAWRSWPVHEWQGKEATIVLVDRMMFPIGYIAVDQIEFSDSPRESSPPSFEEAQDWGTLALACTEPGTGEALLPDGRLPEEFGRTDASYSVHPLHCGILQTAAAAIAPGEKHTFTFALAWHFPNQFIGDKFVITQWNVPPTRVGHAYENWFGDASEVIGYLMAERGRLAGDTRLWRDTFYDSTLPYWLLDRLHSTISCLASGTCLWWKSGRFWAYEGVASCHGTCTHVWNYAQSHARLFPELARSVCEMQDFSPRAQGGGFHVDSGLVGFRSDDAYAADGQCGTVLRAYREHRTSPDSAFLERNWPKIKKALEYSIGRDENGDGMIEDVQHNTYDIDYYGANTLVGALYHAALRAGEEMALEAGDRAFAKKVRAIYKQGVENTQRRLWNGEYYVQDVDLKAHPADQYKDGCLSDQMLGQSLAHLLSLGYLYPKENVVQALQSVWRYNWIPDIAPYYAVYKPFRHFISPGQAGLITCTWPKSKYLTEGTRYREEVWTGIEYQVASHLIWEGMLDEGLAICRAVHDRYHPANFNPYNEVECGDHYARALASWGVYLSLAGFEYHGPKGHLAFAPRISPEDFRAAFTAAGGWGAFAQSISGGSQEASLRLHWGALKLARLSLDAKKPSKVSVSVDGVSAAVKHTHLNGRVTLNFSPELTLNAGQQLTAVLHFS